MAGVLPAPPELTYCPVVGAESQTWLFVMKSDDERSWAANRGYDDSAGIYYSYDSNVARSSKVSAGDLVVLRHDDYVAGWGYVERVDVNPHDTKEIHRCPRCRQTRWRERKTIVPHLICDACGHGFEAPDLVIDHVPVTSYRAFYANSWIEAARPVTFRDPLLTSALTTTDTFNAIRPLDRPAVQPLLDHISGRGVDLAFEVPPVVIEIAGGHTTGVVRRRRGQREFRFRMMERFGERCAITGDQPPQVLEAAHLYSYAEKAVHHHSGGLLLRRDHHALFDAKLLTINPDSWRLEIAPSLRRFETYRSVEGRDLQVERSLRPDRTLVEEHYEEAQRVFANSA
jgi:hypothetical protein